MASLPLPCGLRFLKTSFSGKPLIWLGALSRPARGLGNALFLANQTTLWFLGLLDPPGPDRATRVSTSCTSGLYPALLLFTKAWFQRPGRVSPWCMPTSTETNIKPTSHCCSLPQRMSPACHRQHRPSVGAGPLVVAVMVALNLSTASLLAAATALPRSRWVAAPSKAGRLHDSSNTGHDQPAVAVAVGVRCGATSSDTSTPGGGDSALEVRRGCYRRVSYLRNNGKKLINNSRLSEI